MKTIARLLLSLCLLFPGLLSPTSTQAAAAAPGDPVPHMVLDIQPPGIFNAPSALTVFGQRVWFIADDGTHGPEWWSSDGTAAGTQRLPLEAGDPHLGFPGMVMGGFLYYLGGDDANGWELWRTDGTPQGTGLVKDLTPGAGGSRLFFLGVFDETLFFAAGDYSGQYLQPWQTDGTGPGTVPLQTNGSRADRIHIAAFKDFLLLTTASYEDGLWLYRMQRDGTGVSLLMNFSDGGGDIAALEDVAIISAGSKMTGAYLVRTDGTSLGTAALPGAAYDGIMQLEAFRGWVYFSTIAISPPDSYLARTQGAGIQTLVQYNGSNTDARVHFLAPAVSRLFFVADLQNPASRAPLVQRMLWAYDPGTNTVTGLQGSRPHNGIGDLLVFGDRVFFAANDASQTNATGMELWYSNGTAAGTRLLADLNPGSGSSAPHAFTRVGGNLFFLADDGTHGVELWFAEVQPHSIMLPLIVR